MWGCFSLSPTTRNNLIIGQSGGATAVINASLVGAVVAALAEEGIDGIYGMLHGIEGLLKRGLDRPAATTFLYVVAAATYTLGGSRDMPI